jgi:predicted ArsR family transcriptional regulator
MPAPHLIDEVATDAAPSLVALLGEARAAIVERLRRSPDRSATELAEHLGISAVATRRHLAVLEEDGLVRAHTVRQGRGRPASRYRLTDAAGRLLPHRYDRLAAEVLEFLTERHGRETLREFLRWRMHREVRGLAEAVTAEDLHDRLSQLADVLSRAGFDASVDGDGSTFRLVQANCAIEDVAREHPELCAYEAASFARVLGDEVTVSRRATLAGGAPACVCTVRRSPRHDVVAHDDAGGAPSAGTPAEGVQL